MYTTPKYDKQTRTIERRVFYTGTDLLLRGTGLCYDRDFTGDGATVQDGRRDRRVERPTVTNNDRFAGVTKYAYKARSGGQWIDIYEPGSVCPVLQGVATTVNSTIMTCLAGSGTAGGLWWLPGFQGRGSALALNTNAAIEVETGQAGALDAAGTTLTDAGATFVTKGITAGDYVHIVAGEDDNTNAVTPGRYVVSSVTSETVLVLTAAASDGGTMEVTYSVTPAAATVMAYLYDGEESGMVEHVQPAAGAVAGTGSGFSYIHGGLTPSADCTVTLANATVTPAYKGYKLLGALTTNDYLITVTTGLQLDKATALATMELDGDGDISILRWDFATWTLIHNSGTALA